MIIGEFPVLCGLIGLVLFAIGFYLTYELYLKVEVHEQGQYYLKDPSQKYYIEYKGTVINLGDYRILRFSMPKSKKKNRLGADLEKIELL